MPTINPPLDHSPPIDGLEFVSVVAVDRSVCPKALARLSAGREHMSRELQALWFLTGASFDLYRRQATHHRQP